MNIFVTGATGFTGSHLVRALVARGDRVVALVRPNSDRSRLAGLPIDYIEGDLNDPAALAQGMAGADWVFHMAAYVELGLVDSTKMWQANVEGTRQVLAAARAANVRRLVYCSTIGVFGHTFGRVVDESFQRLQAQFDSDYDHTKYEAQALVDRAAAEGLAAVSILPSGIFGGDDPHLGPVLRQFLRGKLPLWAGGDRPTGLVHVDDLVQGAILAAERGQPGSWYILSTGECTTREMFQRVGQAWGITPPKEAPKWLVRLAGLLLDPIGRLFRWQPPLSRERVRYIYDRCVRVDATKARQELGWNPRSLEQTLTDTIAEMVQLGYVTAPQKPTK
jgi:nucleoside-diphosphate-sugar epimerase